MNLWLFSLDYAGKARLIGQTNATDLNRDASVNALLHLVLNGPLVLGPALANMSLFTASAASVRLGHHDAGARLHGWPCGALPGAGGCGGLHGPGLLEQGAQGRAGNLPDPPQGRHSVGVSATADETRS
eukprot:GAFH01000170.1.p3 GENE.GAFH01000170.1~~GAFH01000170.1.p3  ORF type:complete len:129 (+),score=22.11 GAFH01000170.1:238-624(+)